MQSTLLADIQGNLPVQDDHPYRTGAWQPNTKEYEVIEPEVVGDLPQDLAGVYLRNTENPLHGSLGRYHPFDGDGMLHSLYIDSGHVEYRNRFIRTDDRQIYLSRKGAQAIIAQYKSLPADEKDEFITFILTQSGLRARHNDRDLIIDNDELVQTFYAFFDCSIVRARAFYLGVKNLDGSMNSTQYALYLINDKVPLASALKYREYIFNITSQIVLTYCEHAPDMVLADLPSVSGYLVRTGKYFREWENATEILFAHVFREGNVQAFKLMLSEKLTFRLDCIIQYFDDLPTIARQFGAIGSACHVNLKHADGTNRLGLKWVVAAAALFGSRGRNRIMSVMDPSGDIRLWVEKYKSYKFGGETCPPFPFDRRFENDHPYSMRQLAAIFGLHGVVELHPNVRQAFGDMFIEAIRYYLYDRLFNKDAIVISGMATKAAVRKRPPVPSRDEPATKK